MYIFFGKIFSIFSWRNFLKNYLNFSNLTSSHGGARNCAYEDMNAAPCENHAKHCNSVGQAGQCVTKGICCNPKGNNSISTDNYQFIVWM